MTYVDGGCVGPAPPGTTYDDTMGCYLTNYFITLVGVVGAIAIMSSKSADSTYKMFAVIFFLGKGLGYGVAGLLHQFATTEELNNANEGWWKTSYVLTLVGNTGICLIGVQMVVDKCEGVVDCLKLYLHLLYGLVVVFYVLASGVVVVTYNMTIAGVATLLGLLFVIVVYCIRLGIPKAVGTMIMVAGLLTQTLLAPTCGDRGYEDCWKDCVLPAPQFNHNAAFHVLFGIGMLVLAITMPSSPDMVSKGYQAVSPA